MIALSVAITFVIPGLWVLAASLRQPGTPPPRTIEWLPNPAAWSNYSLVFELVPLGSYLTNSLIVTLIAVPLTVIIASWAAFAMAQLPAPLRYSLLALAVALRMVPLPALWLTRFLVLSELRLTDSFAALLAPAWMGSSPFFVLIYYWSFRRMSPALIEAARLEGLGPLAIWARIALPLARPATVAVSVLTFVQYWSDFINPLLYLKSESRYTLAVGLRILQQLDATNWPLLMAGVVIMVLPIIALFILAQRAFWVEERIAGVHGN
ncbi:MAG: carbohydrate ABC transporter permease [Oscillochloris sp.]|nr:carbohydrate ABC transporter permease [Oscillochloris sp.]